MENITFRNALDSDTQEIESLFKTVLKEFDLDYVEGRSNRDITDIENKYRDNAVFYLALNEKNKIVGMVGLLEVDEQKSKLTKFYILNEARGKGLGVALLEKVIAFAKSRKRNYIYLETNQQLEAAIHLFEKFGFKKGEGGNFPPACDRFYSLSLA